MLQRLAFRSSADFVSQWLQNLLRQPLIVIKVEIKTPLTQSFGQQMLNTQPRRLHSLALKKRGGVLD
jgi:hypothetical protein